MFKKMLLFAAGSVCALTVLVAQPPKGTRWSEDGNGYYSNDKDGIVLHQLSAREDKTIASAQQLTPSGETKPLKVRNFFLSNDGNKVLIYTNSKRVWRYDTRGDYWVLDLKKNTLKQLGKKLPESSLMYAKFSPDGSKVAYGSKHNLYIEDLATSAVKQLTTDGTDRLINATFDWVYEEEFGCRDGFRWSPDGRSIAYWQVDARKIRNFLMINNTDSIYSFTIPVEYPKVGEPPSPVKIGVVNITSGKTTWLKVPGDPQQNYLPRMEWASNNEVAIQQLNRKQNTSILYYANILTGESKSFYKESDNAWINIKSRWHDDDPSGWDWIRNRTAFLWMTEKDGWRHLYEVSKDGKTETLVTKDDYDVISLLATDEKEGYVYFMASPENATQQYLYRTKLDGTGNAELLSPANEKGTHEYDISPNGKYAIHEFSNANTFPTEDLIALPSNTILQAGDNAQPTQKLPHVDFFQVTTADNITMDGWMVKPDNFDSTKKYPVVFMVYTEPGSATVTDKFGVGRNGTYAGSMAADGYIYISLDGRGTPAPKGAAWRKSIYKKVGILNIHDQAEAAKKILQWPFVDTSRIAVWGWSGGGSTTLNLMFQHPEIYKTGIAVAPVANQLTYDDIYEERYMGLPQEDNGETYKKASPITYAKNLQGNLLLVHGTGDDNVHYQNSEMLINQLIKYNKVFQFMAYPNRSHGIYEGEGTRKHLSTIYTNYLKTFCPPGGR